VQGPSHALRTAAAQHGYLLQPDLYAWLDGLHETDDRWEAAVVVVVVAAGV